MGAENTGSWSVQKYYHDNYRAIKGKSKLALTHHNLPSTYILSLYAPLFRWLDGRIGKCCSFSSGPPNQKSSPMSTRLPVKHVRFFLVPCKKWHAAVQVYTGQITFSKVPEKKCLSGRVVFRMVILIWNVKILRFCLPLNWKLQKAKILAYSIYNTGSLVP